MTPQTVNLEVAKQLKEAGWKKYTTFSESENGAVFLKPQMHEILEELPKEVSIEKYQDGYMPRYKSIIVLDRNETTENAELFENPHDALAYLWLWCVKEGYILSSQQDLFASSPW